MPCRGYRAGWCLERRGIRSSDSWQLGGFDVRQPRHNGGKGRTCKDNNAASGGKAVHLNQKLVESVLPLIIASSKPASTPGTPNGIDFICPEQNGVGFPWEEMGGPGQ